MLNMKLITLVLLMFAMAWCQMDNNNNNKSNNKSNNSNSISSEHTQCLKASQCLEVDMSACNCNDNQLCAQTERTCTMCPQLTCYDRVSDSESSSQSGRRVAFIASAIVFTLITLVAILFFTIYYRNKDEICNQGGFLRFLKRRTRRHHTKFTGNYKDKPMVYTKYHNWASSGSLFLTSRSDNLEADKVQPIVVDWDERSSVNPDESRIEVVNILTRSRSTKSDYLEDHPLPPAPWSSIASSQFDAAPPSKYSTKLESPYGTRLTHFTGTKISEVISYAKHSRQGSNYRTLRDDEEAPFALHPPCPAYFSRKWSLTATELSHALQSPRPEDSFATQILSNPLVTSAIGPTTHHHHHSSSTSGNGNPTRHATRSLSDLAFYPPSAPTHNDLYIDTLPTVSPHHYHSHSSQGGEESIFRYQ